ncbi:MAG: ABC transporter permease [Saprospiraceae bacterium]
MKSLLKMAYRNIWRNRSRTLITAAAVMFGVFLSILLTSFQNGSWDGMINGIVENYYGYAQVHSKGYWEDQVIDGAFEYTDELKNLDKNENISAAIPRLEGFVLVAHETGTTAKQVIGTDPVAEDKMTNLSDSVKVGKYLTANDDGVLISDSMSRELNVTVGDTLVFIGSGFRGSSAVGKNVIRGVVKFRMPQMREMIFMSLAEAQKLFAAPDYITNLVLHSDKPSKMKSTVAALQGELDTASTYEIMYWEQLIPELIKSKELDEAGNKIIPFLLYAIIGFVIFGTILMMLKEREYEFGVMTAIGMKRWRLGVMVMLETLAINFLGVLAGTIAALPIVYHFYTNPIPISSMGEGAKETYESFGIPPEIPFSFDLNIFLNEAITIFILSMILSLLIFRKVRKLKAIEAMRH